MSGDDSTPWPARCCARARLRRLAAGNARDAVDLATRLVSTDPLDEDAHVLLVRAFAATGDEIAVERQLEASADLFRREFGSELGPELYEAARMDTVAASPGRPPAGRRRGRWWNRATRRCSPAPWTSGLHDLRTAANEARDVGDSTQEAEAWFALGSALVHAAKGRDEEGSAALHRVIALSEESGDRRLAAACHRELGYVELLRADYPRAQVWLRTASELAEGGDALEISRIRSVIAIALSDVGLHDQAEREFLAAIELARQVDHGRQTAWALTGFGRAQLLRDRLHEAEDALTEAARPGTSRAVDRVPVISRGTLGRGVGSPRPCRHGRGGVRARLHVGVLRG